MPVVVVSKRNGGDRGEYIGRPSPLGNPYRPAPNLPGTTLVTYAQWLRKQVANMTLAGWELKRLTDLLYPPNDTEQEVVLCCWCAPNPCHGDVVAVAMEERWVYRCYPGLGRHDFTARCFCGALCCVECDDVGSGYLCDPCGADTRFVPQ